MKRRGWLLSILILTLLAGIGWHVLLLRLPTDDLIGNGDFSNGQFHLRYFAPAASLWSAEGVNLYRTVLRVDTREVEDWLDFSQFHPIPENWEIGDRHQYLVERRDGDGKRVINITLRQLTLNDLPIRLGLVALVTFLAIFGIVLRQDIQPSSLPLVTYAGGTLLGLGWWTFGISFCYLGIVWPFFGQFTFHIIANTLSFGSVLHLAFAYTPSIQWYQRHRRKILLLTYGLYPLGLVVIGAAGLEVTSALYWEYQAAIALKAASYFIWTIQYRRASVIQRGQMHWLLAGITLYDLVYIVQVVSANETLLPLVQWVAVLPPLGFVMALLPGRSLRIALEPAYSVVQGIANTLTLALFLCGLGLAATVLATNQQWQALPIATIVLAIVFSLTTAPLSILLREQFDNWFGGTRGAQRALLHHFTQQVSNQIALNGILKNFHEALDQGVQCSKMALWLWEEESEMLRAVETPANIPEVIHLDDHQQGLLQLRQNFIPLTPDASFLLSAEERTQFYGLIVLATQGKLVGVCAIGSRIDGGNYSADTINFFETLSRSATLAFHNAQLVQQLENSVFALRQAYQQLVTAQESERQRLAAELHDETLQQLAHINLIAGGLRSQTNGAHQEIVKQLQTNVVTTERGLREILRGLHPAALLDLGLIPALESWLPRRNEVAISMTVNGFEGRRLPDPNLELAIYRLAQESINNALKHAQASRIELGLRWQENSVILEVVDDGIGFVLPFNRQEKSGHFGLLNLHERVRALNGTISVKSQRGTTIKIVLPVEVQGREE